MAFPEQIDGTTPADADSPRQGASKIRSLTQFLIDVFGMAAAPSTISAACGSISTSGKFTITNGTWQGDPISLAGAYVSGILPTANGGTGIAYFTAAGPTVARVYTFPDQAATMLYSGGALGTPSSGTATNLTGLPLTTGVSGVLPVANGGTATSTAFTTGSVVFAGASGVYSQNNANLFWDNTNNRLGVGTTTPGAKLDVQTSAIVIANFNSTAVTDGGYIRIQNNGTTLSVIGSPTAIGGALGTANDILYAVADTTRNAIYAGGGSVILATYNGGYQDRLHITNSGNVGIGMTTTVQFELSGSIGQKATGTTWSNPSDRRLKDHITDYTDGLEVLKRVRPVRYVLNGLAGTPQGQKGISVIAQEMLQAMPYTIETYQAKLHPGDTETTKLYRFEGSAVTFALVNAVKELDARLTALGG